MVNDYNKGDFSRILKAGILHLLPYTDTRCLSENIFENLITGLDKEIFSQAICYLSGDNDGQGPLEKQGYEVIRLGIPKKGLKSFKPSIVFQIARILKKGTIEIIHCQRHKATVYGTLAAWIAGRHVKVVTTIHGLNRTRTLGRKLLNWFLFKRISRIVGVSFAVRNDILKTNKISSPDKVVTVYDGIDAKQFTDSNLTQKEARDRLGLPDKEAFIFGTVGRLTKIKGQTILLKAFASVCQKYPTSWLVLAGKGPLEIELRHLAAKLNIDKRVIFLGHRKDIPEVLRAYDVFVLPSFSEGFGMALVEAMASSIPVIASRVGSIPEILNGPEPRMLVAPSSVEELALAMERFCGMDKVKRDEIGKALRDRVLNEFTKEKMTSAMSKEYIAVMNEARS